MKRNIWSLGERTVNGNYNRIMVAGELHVSNSTVQKLYCAGEVTADGCHLEKLRCAGDFQSKDLIFGDAKIVGDIAMEGASEGDTIIAFGDVNCEYIRCRIYRNGLTKEKYNHKGDHCLRGCIQAETFENFDDTILECEYNFKNIVSCKLLQNPTISCERFFSYGRVLSEEINAEDIYLFPLSESHPGSLCGSSITVSSKFRKHLPDKLVPLSLSRASYAPSQPASMMSVDTVEGDQICLERVKAELVSGKDVEIGDLCIVERVEHTGELHISAKAVVNECIKL